MILAILAIAEPGLTLKRSFGVYNGKRWTNSYNITEARCSAGDLWDPTFIGAFCPPETGQYRLKLTGTIDDANEKPNSLYTFMGQSSNSRTTEFYELKDTVCYPYSFRSGMYKISGKLELSYQRLNGKETLITSDTSVRSTNYECRYGGSYPDCAPKPTTKFSSPAVEGSGILKLLMAFLII